LLHAAAVVTRGPIAAPRHLGEAAMSTPERACPVTLTDGSLERPRAEYRYIVSGERAFAP